MDTTIYSMSVMCVRAIISVTAKDANKYFIERRLKTENIGTAFENHSKYRIDLYISYWVFLSKGLRPFQNTNYTCDSHTSFYKYDL